MRLLLLIAAIALAGCSHGSNHGGVVQHVQSHVVANANGGASTEAAFENDQLIPVEIKGQRFFVRSREAQLEKFPCDRCHSVPLAQMKHDGKDGKPRAHWNIALNHAGEQTMSCATCHNAANVNQVRTLNNHPVELNRSHEVCAQCHSKQASDWAGGAHGKRVAGWAPPRVSMTCAECHNPHAPAWDHRYPARSARREDKPGHE